MEEEEESLQTCPKAHKAHNNLVMCLKLWGKEGRLVGVGMGRWEFCLGRKLFFFSFTKGGGGTTLRVKGHDIIYIND